MNETHVVIGAGPLGRAVVEQLRGADQYVRLVNRSKPASIPDDVSFNQADVSDPPEAVAACSGADMIYDCVGLPYAAWTEEFPAITDGLLRGAEAAGARLVVADNLYAYGPTDGPITERHSDGATDHKGKARAERTRTYLENSEVPVTVGRASNFFGPGVVDTAPFTDPFGAALRGERVSVLGDLECPHTFCYLPDFAAALVTLGAHKDAVGEVWHVPHPKTVTTGKFVTMIFAEAGTERSVRTAPWFVEALLGLINADVRELRAVKYQFTQPFVVVDSKFTDAFELPTTPLGEAIRDTLAWHRRSHE
jgi:nucleoside-diphosphate-sugar epimerase